MEKYCSSIKQAARNRRIAKKCKHDNSIITDFLICSSSASVRKVSEIKMKSEGMEKCMRAFSRKVI